MTCVHQIAFKYSLWFVKPSWIRTPWTCPYKLLYFMGAPVRASFRLFCHFGRTGPYRPVHMYRYVWACTGHR